MMKRYWLNFALAFGALALAGGLMLTPSLASARVFVHVGVGPGWGPYYYYPPPVVYYPPPPVAYVPPPVIYTPPPPAPLAPQAQTWYYCDNPQGYYPYISSCASGWRQVPAQRTGK